MSETAGDLQDLLQRAVDALVGSGDIERDALADAGAALEQAVDQCPPGLPGVGTLLSLALEALEGAFAGTLDRQASVGAARAACAATVACLDPAASDTTAQVNAAGEALWTLLGRDPDLCPFARRDHCLSATAVSERVAALIALSPEDAPELANLAAWLIERAEDESLEGPARIAADRARVLIFSVLDGEADDPQGALDEAAEALGAPGAQPPGITGEAMLPAEPECLQFIGDAPLLAEFVAESLDHIQSAEAGMLAIETDPGDTEAVAAVFRAFHTIKGAAGFLGLAQIQELAHKAENLLDRVREGEIRLTGHYADLALASSDMLREMLEDLDGWQEGDLPPAPEGFERLIALLREPGPGTPGIEPAPTPHRSDLSPAPQRKAPHSAGDSGVRVRTERLDALINMVGELVIANAMLAQDEELRAHSDQAVVRKIDQISKITRELQDVSMSLRMVPLSGTFQRMARLTRDLARKSGKDVELVTEGEDTEIDRNMVEAIGDPLLHMIRNAVDHGLESAQERRAAGKPETGTVTLRACHAAGSVVIELSDDGRGLDRDRIYAKAVRNGVISDGAQLSDDEVYRLIFSAGLSTAEQVTDISGRGVGMDVVRRNIEAMRGRVEITSTLGEGTTFTVRVPLTLAIIDGMLLRVGPERFILPTISILRAVRPEAGSVSTVGGRRELFDLQGSLLPVLRLHELLGIGGGAAEVTEALLVVTEAGGATVALVVDELLGQQQIVIKSLSDGLGEVPCVAGAAILGDGSVGLILDVEGLIRLARTTDTAGAA